MQLNLETDVVLFVNQSTGEEAAVDLTETMIVFETIEAAVPEDATPQERTLHIIREVKQWFLRELSWEVSSGMALQAFIGIVNEWSEFKKKLSNSQNLQQSTPESTSWLCRLLNVVSSIKRFLLSLLGKSCNNDKPTQS